MRAVRLAALVLVACVLGSMSACAGRYHADEPGSAAPPGVDDLEHYRLDLAHQAREQLRARWLAHGAVPRPPMPPMLAEEPGEPPFPHASWVPGTWQWSLGQWRWRPGYWTEPDLFVAYDDPGIPDLAIGGAIGAGTSFGLTDAAVRDHRDRRTYPAVRDHRDERMFPTVRDHRDRSRYPTVRDHRSGKQRDDRSTSWDSDSTRSDSRSTDDDDDDKAPDFGGGRFLRPQ